MGSWSLCQARKAHFLLCPDPGISWHLSAAHIRELNRKGCEHYYYVVWRGLLWSNVCFLHCPSLLLLPPTLLRCYFYFSQPQCSVESAECRSCFIVTLTLDPEGNKGTYYSLALFQTAKPSWPLGFGELGSGINLQAKEWLVLHTIRWQWSLG